MVPPGWNVTEPIGVAIKLFEFADKLREAPDNAKHFKSKLEIFRSSWAALDKIFQDIGDSEGDPLLTENLQNVKNQVAGLQDCIKHCNKFIRKHALLTDDGGKSKGPSRVRWVWDEKSADHLLRRIESHQIALQLSISINWFARTYGCQGQDRQTPPQITSPARTDTSATLAPYTPPKGGHGEDGEVKPKTPAGWLGIHSSFGDEEEDSQPSPIVNNSIQSFPTSSEILPCGAFEKFRRYSSFSIDGVLPERSLRNLENVLMRLEKRNQKPITVPLAKIEAFERHRDDNRTILFSLPPKYSTRYYLNCISSRATIPRVQHPVASDPKDPYKITLERIDFWSENWSPRKGSTSSSFLNESPSVESSAASTKSTSTSASTYSGGNFNEEDRLVLKFRKSEDYTWFQEFVIGQDVRLQAQIPVWEINSKCRRSNQGGPESRVECVRLWRRGPFQYILFYANLSSEARHKEYRMSHFRLENHSEKCIKLRTDLPNPARESEPRMGLTRPIDMKYLTDLEYLKIEFEDPNDKDFFVMSARFGSFDDSPTIPPFSFEPQSPDLMSDPTSSRSQSYDLGSSPFFNGHEPSA